MDAYLCDVCGYCYDPTYGDDLNGIEEGTAFSELPKDWVCPECGASKRDFYAVEEEEEPLPVFDDDDEDDAGWEDDGL